MTTSIHTAGERQHGTAALIALGLALALGPDARAQQYEAPPTLAASAILPADLLQGPEHRVDEQVRNDGYLNHYVLHSRFGRFDAVSTSILRKRIHEVAALAAMEKVSSTDVFAQAAVKASESAVQGVKNVVVNPIGSVEGAVSGVSKIFGRVGEGLFGSHRSDAEDDQVKSLIGFSTVKREYAAQFGVDPYSRNKVLQDRLDTMSWAGFAGDLAPKAALSAVPGGAGAAISVTQNTEMLNEAVRTTTPVDLRKGNRQALTEMGVSKDVAELFVNNEIYTPLEQTMLVRALAEMNGVKNREAFVHFAVLTQDADVAHFRQRQAQMYAAFHRGVAPVAAFVPIGQLAAAQLADGTLVFAAPLDHLSWTQTSGPYVAQVSDYVDQAIKPTAKQLWLAGVASDMARSNLAQHGWQVTENADGRLLPNVPY